MNSQEFLLLALRHLSRLQGGRDGGGGTPAPAPGAVGALGAAGALVGGVRGRYPQAALARLGGALNRRGLGQALAGAQPPPAAGMVMGVLGRGALGGRLVPPSRRARRHRVARSAGLAMALPAASTTPAVPMLALSHALHRWLYPGAARLYPGLHGMRDRQGRLDG